MRLMLALGILFVLIGGYILVQGFSITRERTVLDVGPLEASVEERRAIPPWVGGVAVAAGLVIIVTGAGAGSNKRL
jgi:hypothetical protein